MSGTPAPLRGDPLPAEDIQGLVGSAMTGALTMAMVFVGDRLGLYKGMKDLGGPATSPELAAKLGLSERWVREWLLQQASARLVECDARAARFWLTRAQQDVLANEEGPDARPRSRRAPLRTIARSSCLPSRPGLACPTTSTASPAPWG